MIWIKILPKYGIEMCQIMKIGQIVVFCDLSDTRLTVPARRPSPISKKYLILVSVCSKQCERNHQVYFKGTFGPLCQKTIIYKWFKWRINDLRSVSARVNARGYPCAKGCNSSASQWLSGEQVRLCSGHPKVHFGTIVEGSWGGGGGGGGVLGGSSGLPHYCTPWPHQLR